MAIHGGVEMTTKSRACLEPGVYRNSRGNQRLLLATVNNRCLYSMDQPDAAVITVTTCSTRTFRTAMGNTPIRTFALEEMKKLAGNLSPMRSRRRSHRFEKWLFYSGAGKASVKALMAKATTEKEAPVEDQKSAHLGETGWLNMLMNFVRRLVARSRLAISAIKRPSASLNQSKTATA
jgi:hypothetical protein